MFGSVRGGPMWMRGNWEAPAAVPSPYPGPRPALQRRPEKGLRPPPGLSCLHTIPPSRVDVWKRVDHLEALCQDEVGRALVAGEPGCVGPQPLCKVIGQRVCLFLVSLCPGSPLQWLFLSCILPSVKASFFPPFHLFHQSATLRGAWELHLCLERPFFNLEHAPPLFIH